MTSVREVTNKKHRVTEVLMTFSGAVNAAEAENPAIYRLVLPGKKGSYTARNAKVIQLKSAGFDAATGTVTLIPGKPFALTKPVQLVIAGLPPSGLQDSSSRYIDGAHTGAPGSNAVAILSGGGATVAALSKARAQVRRPLDRIAAIDDLLAHGELADVRRSARTRRRERHRR
jgi:hypothetical protein